MSLLLDVMLRSSAVLAVALLALPLLRGGSAALRHSVLAGAIATSALVLPLSWALPAWTVQVPAVMATPLSVSGEFAPAPAAAAVDAVVAVRPLGLETLMVIVWAIGVGAGAVGLALAFGRLRRVVVRAVPVIDGPWFRGAADMSARIGVGRPDSTDPEIVSRFRPTPPTFWRPGVSCALASCCPRTRTAGATSGSTPCLGMNSRTSSVTIGWCKSPPS